MEMLSFFHKCFQILLNFSRKFMKIWKSTFLGVWGRSPQKSGHFLQTYSKNQWKSPLSENLHEF